MRSVKTPNINLESNDDMFVLSDDEDTNIDNETNERDIYTRPLTSINEWRNIVTQMIENELQEDQDNEVASIANTYNISIDNIEQLQHPAVDLQGIF
ncbi:hypothetical protein C1646_767623 [Rhizophagus diaphanus]|nr:hypothetical protein C1646_767623 [Rhizophagus diaphanus] [Rhizophagus sp. MUCL 43196]